MEEMPARRSGRTETILEKKMPSLNGKVAVITGASRGIGAAAARILAREGAAVALLARSEGACQALAEEIRADGGRALALGCDVSSGKEVAKAARALREELGRVDILVNNAGVVEPIGKLADCPPEEWIRNIEINLGGALRLLHALLPDLLAADGTVVNVSSGAAHRPMEGWSAYCAGKAGLAMVTRSLHLEYGDEGLRAFGFIPGVVDTEMQVQIRASGINEVSRLPRESLASPERPAQVIAWLCGPEANDLMGQEVSIRDEALQKRVGLEVQ
jgi:NAD(P)-dependent dehydrogenase (short-subunit alcohol dehydrogenase family)